MNFPIKPVCNSRFIRKDGTCLIYIQYCFSHESRTLLNTEIAIPPEYWNQKKECISEKLPKSFGIADEEKQKKTLENDNSPFSDSVFQFDFVLLG